MKKIVKLSGLDCANCAAKMEDAVRGIKGVEQVSVNFLTQKMQIEADEAGLPAILKEAKRLIGRIDPDVEMEG